MIYGYCRCSTNETKQDINRQIRELKELGATDTTIYQEYLTGSATNKPELDKLLSVIREGDTLCVTEVSRLSRSTKQLIEVIEKVQSLKIKLVIKNSITIDCTNGQLDPMTKAFLQITAVFAELEKDMIRERVRSGIANAKAKGKQIGRPTLTLNDIPKKVKETYNDLYTKGKISKTDFALMCKISRPTLDKYLKVIEAKEQTNDT